MLRKSSLHAIFIDNMEIVEYIEQNNVIDLWLKHESLAFKFVDRRIQQNVGHRPDEE